MNNFTSVFKKTKSNIEISNSLMFEIEIKDEKWEKLFKTVFSNMLLFKLISRHIRLYKNNEFVKFINRKELLEYKEREYISKLVYEGDEILIQGDLPTGGVLKEVILFKGIISSIQGDLIPDGAEIIEYCQMNDDENETSLSNLPSTIHTIKNAVVEIDKHYQIPSNITSISFRNCPHDLGSKFIIPNTIKELKINFISQKRDYKLNQGDIPYGITNLSIEYYRIKNLSEGILPTSIKELKITCDSESDEKKFDKHKTRNNDRIKTKNKKSEVEYSIKLFNFMQPLINLQTLHISLKDCKISPESNLVKCTSIKILNIYFSRENGIQLIKTNSLPSSIIELNLTGCSGNLEKNVIPNSVTNLKIYFTNIEPEEISKGAIPNSVVSLKLNKKVTKAGVFPSSLTDFSFFDSSNYPHKQIVKMISLLPKSLKSISLPKKFKDDISLPNTINKINYI